MNLPLHVTVLMKNGRNDRTDPPRSNRPLGLSSNLFDLLKWNRRQLRQLPNLPHRDRHFRGALFRNRLGFIRLTNRFPGHNLKSHTAPNGNN